MVALYAKYIAARATAMIPSQLSPTAVPTPASKMHEWMGCRTRLYGPLVTSSGSSFCDMGAPVAADLVPCPDREPEPEREQDEADASAPGDPSSGRRL